MIIPSSAPRIRSTSGIAISLVDDDSSVRKSIGRLLESAGFKVHTFCDAELFLQHLAVNEVPLVILDIWMERMTGLELLVHLRAQAPETKTIFITGFDDPVAERTVRQAGAVAFFRKPFDDEKFITAVKSALNRQFIPSKES